MEKVTYLVNHGGNYQSCQNRIENINAGNNNDIILTRISFKLVFDCIIDAKSESKPNTTHCKPAGIVGGV